MYSLSVLFSLCVPGEILVFSFWFSSPSFSLLSPAYFRVHVGGFLVSLVKFISYAKCLQRIKLCFEFKSHL